MHSTSPARPAEPTPPTAKTSTLTALLHSARRLTPLAWPTLVGQLAVLSFAVVDTVLVARFAAADLAALAIGTAAYIATFVGLMGVVAALGPIAGQLFGAGQHAKAGRQAHQAVWLALGLSALGMVLLAFPQPFLALAHASPEVSAKVRAYLGVQALALPASLLFTVFRSFNTAVSRPKVVMRYQVGGLALKVPLSLALVFGVPAIGLPALGVVGCAIATAVAMWMQVLLAWARVRRDPFYAPFQLMGRGLDRPERAALLAQLRLGVPMGASIWTEMMGFAFMALFISRLGTTAVAGHQVAMNIVSVMFMVPLALASASAALVAQRIGAADPVDARRLGWHSLTIGLALATLMGCTVWVVRHVVVGWYTVDPAVQAAALSLIAWLVLFHVADAAQTVAAFVLRAYRIATVPLLIYVGALWGVGLGGGYYLAFNVSGSVPLALRGAPGYWFAATAGLVVAAALLIAFMALVLRPEVVKEGVAARV